MCPAVSITKRVNCINLRQSMRSAFGKKFRRNSAQIMGGFQFGEYAIHLLVNKFGIAEPVTSLADANIARLASPLINILKEVVM